jgi:hypothetical protein
MTSEHFPSPSGRQLPGRLSHFHPTNCRHVCTVVRLLRTALHAWRCTSLRALMTSAKPYPYSQVAIIPPTPAGSPPAALRQGKGLMAYLQQTLPSTEKQKIIGTLFSRTHPERVRPGSVLTVNLTHAPTTFSGVLISVRRRGPDTSGTWCSARASNRNAILCQLAPRQGNHRDIQGRRQRR